jgi:hypothetical protein
VDTGTGGFDNFVDNHVVDPEARRLLFVLPEGAVRGRGTEITSRDPVPDRSLRALRYPVAMILCGHPRVSRPAGRDRHPGVGTSVGRQKLRASAVDPLDEPLEARMLRFAR